MLDTIIGLFQPLILLKIVAIILVLMIVIFLLVVAKQSRDMDDTIVLGSSGKLVQLISYINVALALSLLLTAIVIL